MTALRTSTQFKKSKVIGIFVVIAFVITVGYTSYAAVKAGNTTINPNKQNIEKRLKSNIDKYQSVIANLPSSMSADDRSVLTAEIDSQISGIQNRLDNLQGIKPKSLKNNLSVKTNLASTTLAKSREVVKERRARLLSMSTSTTSTSTQVKSNLINRKTNPTALLQAKINVLETITNPTNFSTISGDALHNLMTATSIDAVQKVRTEIVKKYLTPKVRNMNVNKNTKKFLNNKHINNKLLKKDIKVATSTATTTADITANTASSTDDIATPIEVASSTPDSTTAPGLNASSTDLTTGTSTATSTTATTTTEQNTSASSTQDQSSPIETASTTDTTASSSASSTEQNP